MKELLEFAGAVLYLIVSILTFPLFVLTQCLLESWAAVKYVRRHYKPWMVKIRKSRRIHNPLPQFIQLAVTRIKSLHW